MQYRTLPSLPHTAQLPEILYFTRALSAELDILCSSFRFAFIVNL